MSEKQWNLSRIGRVPHSILTIRRLSSGRMQRIMAPDGPIEFEALH